MNKFNEPFTALEPPVRGAAKRFPGEIHTKIFLPKEIYEALPAAYVLIGALFILGAVYIGPGYAPMVGYLAVGLLCIFAGVTVNSIRRRERSKSENAVA